MDTGRATTLMMLAAGAARQRDGGEQEQGRGNPALCALLHAHAAQEGAWQAQAQDAAAHSALQQLLLAAAATGHSPAQRPGLAGPEAAAAVSAVLQQLLGLQQAAAAPAPSSRLQGAQWGLTLQRDRQGPSADNQVRLQAACHRRARSALASDGKGKDQGSVDAPHIQSQRTPTDRWPGRYLPPSPASRAACRSPNAPLGYILARVPPPRALLALHPHPPAWPLNRPPSHMHVPLGGSLPLQLSSPPPLPPNARLTPASSPLGRLRLLHWAPAAARRTAMTAATATASTSSWCRGARSAAPRRRPRPPLPLPLLLPPRLRSSRATASGRVGSPPPAARPGPRGGPAAATSASTRQRARRRRLRVPRHGWCYRPTPVAATTATSRAHRHCRASAHLTLCCCCSSSSPQAPPQSATASLARAPKRRHRAETRQPRLAPPAPRGLLVACSRAQSRRRRRAL